MLAQLAAQASEEKPGLLEILPPAWLTIVGFVLVAIAALIHRLNKRDVENNSAMGDVFYIIMWIVGIAGVGALYQGLFGGNLF